MDARRSDRGDGDVGAGVIHVGYSRLPSTRRWRGAADRVVCVIRGAPEDVGQNMVMDANGEGHGHVPSSIARFDQLGCSPTNHVGRGVSWSGYDRRHDRSVRYAQPSKAVDAELAVHDGIRVRTDLGSSYGMSCLSG
jgi:hypothetical protein